VCRLRGPDREGPEPARRGRLGQRQPGRRAGHRRLRPGGHRPPGLRGEGGRPRLRRRPRPRRRRLGRRRPGAGPAQPPAGGSRPGRARAPPRHDSGSPVPGLGLAGGRPGHAGGAVGRVGLPPGRPGRAAPPGRHHGHPGLAGHPGRLGLVGGGAAGHPARPAGPGGAGRPPPVLRGRGHHRRRGPVRPLARAARPPPLRPGPAPAAGAGLGHGHGAARRGRGAGAGRAGGGGRPVRGPPGPEAGHRRGRRGGPLLDRPVAVDRRVGPGRGRAGRRGHRGHRQPGGPAGGPGDPGRSRHRPVPDRAAGRGCPELQGPWPTGSRGCSFPWSSASPP
jgi:hypothetical protein